MNLLDLFKPKPKDDAEFLCRATEILMPILERGDKVEFYIEGSGRVVMGITTRE